MIDATPYTVPKEPGRWRAIFLAALVHAALVAFLWIGVRWQSETPVTIEAEIWDPQLREAAPQPEPVKEPAPVKEPEPQPVIKETPKPKVEEPPVAKPPDIALEQEKKRKEQEEKKRREEEQERLAMQKQKAEEERLAKLKQKEEEKRKLEKEEAEKAKKLAAEKKRKEDEAEAKRKQQAEDAMLAKMREENMRRITGAVSTTGGTGDAAKSQGNRGDPTYAQRVAAKIKSNLSFNVPDNMPGNPPVEYIVELLPDGSVAGMRKVKSSGVPGFDEAVQRAIEKSQPFPKDKSGSVPSSFVGIHKPKDQ